MTGGQFCGARIYLRMVLGALVTCFSCQVLANNGLNLIGVGVESTAMGGADVAVSRDTTAVSVNPAGLSRIGKAQLDLYAAVAYAIDVAHADALGNDKAVSNSVIPLGGLGYARRGGASKWTYGFGFFGQGGAGNVYKDLNTAFGTVDELSSQVGFGKISLGASFEATDRLSVGGAAYAAVGILKQKVFPQTSFFNASDPSQSFFGYAIENAHAENIGIKVGVQYDAASSVRIGATFSPEVRLPFEGGTLRANFSATGLGTVTYRQVRLEGLALPREIALGVAWRMTPATLLSVETSWLNWAHALRTQTLVASAPDVAAAPSELRSSGSLNWKNQTVVAVGIAHDLNERAMLYGGFNYGRNPAPPETLNPVFAPLGQRHLTGGGAWKLKEGWSMAAGVEYLFPERVTYSNPEIPIPASEERLEYVAFHFLLSRRW